MSVDFPRAWEIARTVPPDQHLHPRCSFRQTNGALLCDCEVLYQHPEVKAQRQSREAAGGMVQVVKMSPEVVPYPVDAEHPPEDFDG